MSKYVNVGGPFQIIDTPHKVEVWGQTIEIPDDLARGAILSGAHLLPADQFAGFTADELAKYPNALAQVSAPPEFHKKLAAAIKAARDYRVELATAPSPGASGIRQPASASEVKS